MFNTTVLELSSGYEKRNQNWAKARARYNVAYGIKKPHQMDQLLNFFYARNGRAHSFPFFDHKDHVIDNQGLGIGDGVRTQFQLFKRYESGGHHYDRVITKIKPGTLGDIRVNGVPYILGDPGPMGFDIGLLSGIITFNEAPPLDADISIDRVEFYVHCRFDTDFADIQLITYEAEAWFDIFIIEIKEDIQ